MPVTDESIAPQFLATFWPLVAVSGVFVSLKLLARARRRMRLWWDDYLMIISWLCLVVASACLTAAVSHGLGRHVQFLDSADCSAVLLLGYIAAFLTMIGSVWSKVSFALFLLSISSSGCTVWIRRGVLVIIFSLNAMLATALTFIIVSCRPVAKTWIPDMDGECLDDDVKVFWAISLAAFSGVADLALAFLPWKIIWCLPIKRRDKMGLVAAMSLGVFAAATSFMKCAYIHQMVAKDFTFEGWKLVFWSIFEPCLTLAAASVPVVRTLLRDLFHSFYRRRVAQHIRSQREQSEGETGSA